jgi:hypothetical protein
MNNTEMEDEQFYKLSEEDIIALNFRQLSDEQRAFRAKVKRRVSNRKYRATHLQKCRQMALKGYHNHSKEINSKKRDEFKQKKIKLREDLMKNPVYVPIIPRMNKLEKTESIFDYSRHQLIELVKEKCPDAKNLPRTSKAELLKIALTN